jgi:NADH-quinone oxidoreductase subunit L
MPAILENKAMAEAYLWAIVFLPLAGALVNGLFGKRLGRGNVAFIAIAMLAGSFLLSLMAFSWVMRGENLILRFGGPPWFRVAGPDGRALVSVSWGLLVDRLSGTMILVVTGVGFLIHVYSASYMSQEDDGGYARYFAYLNLFVAAMLILVLGDSLALTFVGWEGVGLCSYLLIGFWYTDEQKAFCGRKAFVVNRIGDLGFLVGLFAIFSIFGTSSYGQLEVLARAAKVDWVLQSGVFAGWTVGAAITFATLGLFVGSTGKSAQLPLYVWLPDAMAGPTPVSALIHAATMVTAGVYLVARTGFLFALAPASMATVTLVGALTALVAAAMAFTQNDIKKVLAYSTVSQLGFMFIGVGAGVFWAGILHLVTHAFFKACLFLGAGSVMHGMGDDTDIRNMGGLWKKMPHTARTFLVATVAIAGVVPLSGFFSKDAILHGVHGIHNPAAAWVGSAAYWLGSAAALGTAFYMTRLYVLTFLGKARTHAAEHAHESSPVMTGPLWVLAVLSVVALVLGLPGHSAVSELFQKFTRPVFAQATTQLLATGHLPREPGGWMGAFAIALVIAWAGALVGWAAYGGAWRALPGRLALAFPRHYQFAYHKFRVDELYDLAVVRPLQAAARGLWAVVDLFAIETVLVNGVPRAVAAFSQIFRVAQNGDVQRYAAVILIAAAAILWTVLGAGGR